MRAEIFNYEKAKYIRVPRNVAKKAYIAGATVIIAPVNANMYFTMQLWCMISKIELKASYGYTPHFDHFINEFSYYNCNSELGKYCKYFILKDEL